MILDLQQEDLKSGVFGLVVALVEIIKESLRSQALKRMEAGSLSEEELERLGQALMELEDAIERIKLEMGVGDAVKAIREELDKAVAGALDTLINPLQRQGAS